MSRYKIDFLEQQITHFEMSKKKLLQDDENYKDHEEKRKELLTYYDRKIKEYETQLIKLNQDSINKIAVVEAKEVI